MNIKNIAKKTVKKLVKREYWGKLYKIIHSENMFEKHSKRKKAIKSYEMMPHRESFDYNKEYAYFIDESKQNAGSCGAYYWQDLWAATKIIKNKPVVHFDIGSRIDGFVAHLQAFGQQVVLIDIRKMESHLPYVSFIQADATSLYGIADESVESISALCSLEHFGLGRYGDEIDPDACFKAMKSIQRVLKKGGHAYIAVPIGAEHLEFNIHRIFFAQTIVDEFDQMELIDFQVNNLSVDMELEKNPSIHQFDNEWENGGARFGLFEFVKK